MTTVADTIREKLEARFHPLILSVTDDSARHAGHAGAAPGGQTHFSVTVVSAAFEGIRSVARHQLVYETLGEQFKAGLHALSIRALTPKEAEKS